MSTLYNDASPVTPISKVIPGNERSVVLTDVDVLSQIDILTVLGRPAQGIILRTYDASDVVTFILNGKRRLTRVEESTANTTETYWGNGTQGTLRGSVEFNSATEMPGFPITSVEIATLSVASGSQLDVIIW